MEVCWPRFTLGMGVRVAGKIEDVLLALVTFLIEQQKCLAKAP